MNKFINTRGARENNLKEISFRTPNPKITIFAGVSGSGKSSIDFGTIATEAQRQIFRRRPAVHGGDLHGQIHRTAAAGTPVCASRMSGTPTRPHSMVRWARARNATGYAGSWEASQTTSWTSPRHSTKAWSRSRSSPSGNWVATRHRGL